jgi:bifunctional enzyme CysN/CysC
MSSMPTPQTLLRFITCGSVDDGKSTLIGRLLFDTKTLFQDQLDGLARVSKQFGGENNQLDLALLVDGLSAEREQGITIDVAYRYFSTPRRKFIVADTPGHEQYTRNMVTGASTADLAIVLVDAEKGLLPQTYRHVVIAHLLGIRNIVLAVNKMDLVVYEQSIFDAHKKGFLVFADRLGLINVNAIPLSGYVGDNVVEPSVHMPWYQGATLLSHLETVVVDGDMIQDGPIRLPVQRVSRLESRERGIAGTLASGQIKVGDDVYVMPSGTLAKIAEIVTFDGAQNTAIAGQAITIRLKPDVDCGRGAVVVAPNDRPLLADQFEAILVWMSQSPLVPGRRYNLKLATQTVPASVSTPKYKYQVETLEHLSASTLTLNDIGVAVVTSARPLVFDPYEASKSMGGFILIDRETHDTVGAGTIRHEMRRSQNIHWQKVQIDRVARSKLMGQQPFVLWFTGLSGAGKSTIASMVEKQLHAMGRHTYLLDGDNLRHRLNRDLGFSATDRIENIRRVGEVSSLMVDAGLIVLAAFVSPFAADRDLVRAMVPDGAFVEIFVDVSLEVAEARDTKGLYKKARVGLLPNFTGIDMPFERPVRPELTLDTDMLTIEACVALVLEHIKQLDNGSL